MPQFEQPFSWTGRCLNPDCKKPQKFELTTTGNTVAYLVCTRCNTSHVLSIIQNENDPKKLTGKFEISKNPFPWKPT